MASDRNRSIRSSARRAAATPSPSSSSGPDCSARAACRSTRR
jgi:hypothetical protein